MSNLKIIFPLFLILLLLVSGCLSDDEKKTSHFEKGLAYFEKGEYKSARLEFKNAIQIDPKYVDAYQKLAETNLKLGDGRKAFRAYSTIAELEPDHLETQLKLATFLMLAKKNEDSREKVDLVLQREPGNVDALLLLGGLYGQEKKFFEAEATFRKVLELDRHEVRASLGLSQVLEVRGKLAEAETTLQQAVRNDPTSLKIRLALFNFYVRAVRFDQAEILIEEIIAENTENAGLYVVLGNFYSRVEKPGPAEAAYLKAIAIDPVNIRHRMILADFYTTVGKKDKILEVCLQALEIEPDNIQIMHTLARHYMSQGNLDQAETQIAQILQKRPSYFPTRMLKGELLTQKREFEAALELFSQLLAEEPGSSLAYYFKGVSHFYLDDVNSARTALFKAVELGAAAVRARLLLAEIYLRNRDFALAQEQATQILLKRPRHYQAWLTLGNAYLYQNKITEATDTFKSLIETAPDNPVGYYRLGVLQRKLGRYQAAMDNFEKAMSLNPKLIDVFTHIIRVHAAKGEYPPALKRCDLQLQQYADSPALAAVVHNLKGDLHLAQGETAAAIESFQTAIQKNPDFLKPYYMLAEIYLAAHQEEKAVARYKGLLEANPKEVQAHMLLGAIYDRQKRYDQSEKHYRAVLEAKPEFAAAANNLAYILADQEKDIDEALRLARLAKEKLPNSPYVMDTLGWAYYKKGLYGSAIGEFTDSLARIPENPAVAYHLGMAYYKNGDAPKARVELEKALSLDKNFAAAEEARRVLAEL